MTHRDRSTDHLVYVSLCVTVCQPKTETTPALPADAASKTDDRIGGANDGRSEVPQRFEGDSRCIGHLSASGSKRPSWRDHIKIHPAAELFPLISPAELAELAVDIKKNGLQIMLALP
jgi:hypothetical protein